jgi:hypothetical protein
MAFLDGLIKAGLYGATGYMAGRADRDARQRAEAEKAAERERQAAQDAARDSLVKAQIDAENALALRRRQPEAPPVRNIDPLSQEGITAAGQRADAIARARARYEAAHPERSLTPGQARDATSDEAQGLAILSSNPLRQPNGRAIQKSFGEAYRAARTRFPDMPPGQLAKLVLDGLKRATPQLFTDGAGAGKTTSSVVPGRLTGPQLLANAQARLQGQTEPFSVGAPPTVTRGYSAEARQRFPGTPAQVSVSAVTSPAPPQAAPAKTPADRWEELVDRGMSEAEATAAVKREFGLP